MSDVNAGIFSLESKRMMDTLTHPPRTSQYATQAGMRVTALRATVTAAVN